MLRFIGGFVKATRLVQAKTQNTLAEEAGINRTTLIQMEKGDGCTLLSLIQVLRALDQLDVFRVFDVHEEISPLLLARDAEAKRKRAPSSKKKEPLKPLDW